MKRNTARNVSLGLLVLTMAFMACNKGENSATAEQQDSEETTTPVIVADTRAKLVQVFVMFRCGSAASIAANNATIAGCNVTDVHVWDGGNRIATFGSFKLFGEHRFRFGTSTTFKLPTPKDIFFGVELAVHVSFSQNEPITFASAGADFQA